MTELPLCNPEKGVVVIGAGPAGLTAAYELVHLGFCPIVVEQRDRVGGISRTESVDGYYFDMGGHRFFTKSEPVNQFWDKVMGSDLLTRPRLSRIYYEGKLFHYPLKPLNALAGLGFYHSALAALSYAWWQLFPYRVEETFEQWVTNRFGRRLFRIFFKTYTEKVWGISCSELRAEWASQRIKSLSLGKALLNSLKSNVHGTSETKITTLIAEFRYPRRGPGMLWDAVKGEIERQGGCVYLDSRVTRVRRVGNRISGVEFANGEREQILAGTSYISSMPVNTLIRILDPPPPAEVLYAAGQLKHRSFLTVCLIVDRADLFPDNWIYVHDPSVRVGRVQNFKNWSSEMVPDASKTSLGLEYFCDEGDALWTMRDEELVALGKREIARIGLADQADVERGYVYRVAKAYPVYDAEYSRHLAMIRRYLATLDNLQTIGRSGLHRYNNQDHAMLTGMLAVRNLAFGEHNDLWSVNADQEYHEKKRPTNEDQQT